MVASGGDCPAAEASLTACTFAACAAYQASSAGLCRALTSFVVAGEKMPTKVAPSVPPCSWRKNIDLPSSAHPTGANASTCATLSFNTTSTGSGGGGGAIPGDSTGVGVGEGSS